MASKLLRQSRLRALCCSHIRSTRFCNTTRATYAFLKFRPFSDASSSPSPEKPLSHCNTKTNTVMERGSTSTSTTPPNPSSLKEPELAKFASIAETWWDSEGPFKPLHVMNPTRLAFIRSVLCRHFRKDPNSARPFEGLKIVDVGCGGGLLSEPLARMGATVTGVDAVEKNIRIARLHAVDLGSESSTLAQFYIFSTAGVGGVFDSLCILLDQDLDPVTSTIEYCCTTAEKLVEEERNFDAVISLEVIEHVADPAEFCNSLAALTVPDGATVISTINRSMRAYATAIVAAEYLLHWLPKGTHQWSSFLTPEELVLIIQRASITVREMAGFVYNPVTGRWSLSDDISVNFISFGTKNSQ